MTQLRAADDFAAIRARLEELRHQRARPRAADDFPVIHARLQELRRERERARARTGHARNTKAHGSAGNGPARE